MTVIEELENWVAALKSGKYNQGECQLRKGSQEEGYEHCCLGVLVEENKDYQLLELPNDRVELGIPQNESYPPYNFTKKLYLNQPLSIIITNTEEFEKWISEFVEEDVKYRYYLTYEIYWFLAKLNDWKVRFSKIAEFIELFFIPYVRELKENERPN